MDESDGPEKMSERAIQDLRALGLVGALTLLIELLGLVAAVIAFMVVPKDGQGAVFAIFLCVFLTATVILLVTEEFRWHRKARYAEAQSFLHDALHKLRDAYWQLNDLAR